MHWGEGRILNYPPPDVNIDVKARAVAETMTVFFLTDHPQSSGDNIILIDAIALYPDDSAPAVELPPTPAPTDTPTPEPPPVAVAVAAAPAVVEQPTLPPTETPTAEPPTATPLPTDTPTATPSQTPTSGSGVYHIEHLTDIEEVRVDTPFGEPSDAYIVGTIDGQRVAFLPRHGRGHRISPSRLNYRANIFGFKLLGVEYLIGVSACGSLQERIAPGHIVVPDQLFDRTHGRAASFFDDPSVGTDGLA